MYPGTFARTNPTRPAIIFTEDGSVMTYAELESRSARLANALRDAGLTKGDCVAIISDNRPDYYVVYWAAVRAGLYFTAVNRHLTPNEATYIVNDSGARALFVSATLPEIATHVHDNTPEIELHLSLGGDLPGYVDLAGILETTSPEIPASQPLGATMLYSSGTTGNPKGVRPPLPDAEVTEASDVILPMLQGPDFGWTEDMVYLSPAPCYHSAPLRFSAMVHAVGGTLVLMRKFDAEDCLRAIETYNVTHAQYVPTMFVRMLKLDTALRTSFDVSSMKVAIHAAAPCPIEIKRQMIDWWGPILLEYYGGTETNGITVATSEQWMAKPGTVGRAVLGIPRICDLKTGQVFDEPDRIGAVYFERDVVPFVYHNDPVKTAAAAHPDHPRWTTMGDIGHLDEDEFLFLSDRKDFMIISGGVNIYPREIEDVLILHDAVQDVAVIGVDDIEMGQRVKGFIELAPGVDPSDDLAVELRQFTRERLASFKAPSEIEFTDNLPRTATGKLQKRKLSV